MLKKIFILTSFILIVGCKTENGKEKTKKISITTNLKSDSIKKKTEQNEDKKSNYKVGHVNDGYGKRLYIDSLHYDIVKRYYYKDSTRLWFEHYSDTRNDTVYRKEYYFNGNPKLINKLTYRQFIKIGCWKYYNKNGTLIKQIDYDSKFPVPFNEALEIAIKNGIPKPIETNITKDSLNWLIMNWTEGSFDTIAQETIGHGLKINIKTGKFEKTTRIRRVEI